MALPKLMLTPSRDGYGADDADDAVLRAKVSAGPSRTRLDMLGATADVSATFRMDRGEYQYWRAFFRLAIGEGSLPFLLDLLLDQPDLVEHEVKLSAPPRLSGQSGLLYVVQLRLEVKPAFQDTTGDEALLWLVQEYGSTDAAAGILLDLEHLVNVDLPAAFG
jgi:hypothetical protein